MKTENMNKQVIGRTRDEMAQRAALDIPDGSYVNLGIGLPERIARFVPEGRELIYHTENGLLGMGPSPAEGEGEPELINAGKRQVTALPGASFFQHPDSFAMIRGGHIDLCVLGALQVAQNGDLANWSTGGANAIPAVGGAMDLVAGVDQIGLAFSLGRGRAHAERAVLGVVDQLAALGHEARDLLGHADAQVDVGAVGDVEGGPLGHLLARPAELLVGAHDG